MLYYVNGLDPAASISDGDQTLITQGGVVKKLNLDAIIKSYLVKKNVFSDATSSDVVVDLASYAGYTDIEIWKIDTTLHAVSITDSRGYPIVGVDVVTLSAGGSAHLALDTSTLTWYGVPSVSAFQVTASTTFVVNIPASGAYTLPAFTSAMWGKLLINGGEANADFNISSSGTVQLLSVDSSALVAVNTTAPGKLCLGGDTAANPVILTNYTDSTISVLLTLFYQ
jgi:hypothetical protein